MVASLGTGIVIQNVVGILFGFDTKDVRAATVGQATMGLKLGPIVMPIASRSIERRTFAPISGLKTFSSRWPCMPPTVTAA